MLAISKSESTLRVVEVEKSLLGKYSVKRAGSDVVDSLQWKSEARAIIKNKHVAFILPDSESFIYRFQIPLDVARDVLKQAVFEKVKNHIQTPPEELLYDFTVVKRDNDTTQHVLFVGTTYDAVSDLFEVWKEGGGKSLVVIPAALAIFEVLKDHLEKDEVVLYIDRGSESATLTFFDTYGPVTSLSAPVPKEKLNEEVKNSLKTFQKEHQTEVKTVILGGNPTSLEEIKKEIENVTVITVDTLAQETLLEKGISFTDSISEYVSNLGLALLSFQNETINLTKKEKILLLEDFVTKKKLVGESQAEKKPVAEPATEEKPAEALSISLEKKQSFPAKKFLIVVLILGLLGSLFFLSRFITLPFAQKEESKKEITQPTTIPTPTLAPLDKANLKIELQNGSGVKGAAKEYKTALEEKAYADIETGNADNFDYEDITLKLKENLKPYKKIIIDDLGVSEDKVTVEDLDDESDFDIVVILGK